MVIGKDLVTVVVPMFNEEKAVGLVLDELFEAGFGKVLVVDGKVKLAAAEECRLHFGEGIIN